MIHDITVMFLRAFTLVPPQACFWRLFKYISFNPQTNLVRPLLYPRRKNTRLSSISSPTATTRRTRTRLRIQARNQVHQKSHRQVFTVTSVAQVTLPSLWLSILSNVLLMYSCCTIIGVIFFVWHEWSVEKNLFTWIIKVRPGCNFSSSNKYWWTVTSPLFLVARLSICRIQWDFIFPFFSSLLHTIFKLPTAPVTGKTFSSASVTASVPDNHCNGLLVYFFTLFFYRIGIFSVFLY